MQGNPRIVSALDGLLAQELSAVNQYIVHSEMAGNWGYDALRGYIVGRALTEMQHAERLIERILFLEGIPTVSNAPQVKIGKDVPQMFAFDHESEKQAIASYNLAIALCIEEKDAATRKVLQKILKDEDDHINAIEERQAQIRQMGTDVFLSTQVGD